MRKFALAIVTFSVSTVFAQEIITNKTGSKYVFKTLYDLPGTEVRDQCKTATCWSFSTLSMLESELLRTGKGKQLKTNPGGTYSKVWIQAVEGVLDAYLGKIPKTFQYRGKEYTPKSLAESLGLNMDDYTALTSFTHHPYNRPFTIEVPDNWSMQQAYNVTLDELTQTTIDALKNGYSVAWAADVSEKGFSFRDGLGIVPVNDTLVKKKGDDSRFFNDAGAMRSGSAFDQPYPEKQITAEIRQDEFDRQLTTDDHGMHITGMLTDQNGTRYFKVKNSWGSGNHCGGYLYVSESYFRLKTISIMLHRQCIDKKTRERLDLD